MNRTDAAGHQLARWSIAIVDKVSGNGAPGTVNYLMLCSLVMWAMTGSVDVVQGRHPFWIFLDLLVLVLFGWLRGSMVKSAKMLATYNEGDMLSIRHERLRAGLISSGRFQLRVNFIFGTVALIPPYHHILSAFTAYSALFAYAIACYAAADGTPGGKQSVLAKAKAKLKAIKAPRLSPWPAPIPAMVRP